MGWMILLLYAVKKASVENNVWFHILFWDLETTMQGNSSERFVSINVKHFMNELTPNEFKFKFKWFAKL